VVELAICEMIALSRGLTDKNRQLHAGVWDKSAKGSHEIRGRRLGIIGYGNIGTQLSVLAESLGLQVYFYDKIDRLRLGNARKCSSLDELLGVVDIVSIHVDGRDANRDFFGVREFSLMRPGSLFLNLSRGFVIDLAALREQLVSGHIAGAAIDVFPEEPKHKAEPFVNALQSMDNVILTPHVGGSTEEAQEHIGQFVSDKLVSFINEGNTSLSVNLPNLVLPPQAGSHRLIHIHRNQPGTLAKINTIFAESGANIVGQYLGTHDYIGYVTTDINKEYPAQIFSALRDLDETIRVRVLY
jgi:D-3-phosphoglycerate dehydrogenase